MDRGDRREDIFINYKALIVEGSGNGHLKTVCDHLHLNPVRVGKMKQKQLLYPTTSRSLTIPRPKLPRAHGGGDPAFARFEIRLPFVICSLASPAYLVCVYGAASGGAYDTRRN
jgi:hypothetical protein